MKEQRPRTDSTWRLYPFGIWWWVIKYEDGGHTRTESPGRSPSLEGKKERVQVPQRDKGLHTPVQRASF